MGCCDNKKTPFTEHSAVKAGQSVIKHFIDPSYNAFASDEVKEKRIKTCGECEELGELFGQKRCNICWCFIEAKASLVDQICPHKNGNKW